MNAGLIEFDTVSKRFEPRGRGHGGTVEALREVSFAVGAGEFVSIIGPSGCGKTTCLRILAGLEIPSDGDVRVAGAVVNGPARNRATVFQAFNLFPWMPVLENVAFPLKAQGREKKERERLAVSYLQRVELAGFERHYPYQLSGGMQQRVGIARALASEAEILLMDEPFGALDAQTRESLQDELLMILERYSKTVVFITHSIDEAVYLSDRILLLQPRPGQVAEVFDVPFGRNRAERRIRSLPEYGELRQKVADRLKRLAATPAVA